MNNTLHTPGPWTHTPSREHSNPDTTRRDIVAESQFGPAFIAGDVSQSDAHLISAAPDLLSALIELERVESSPHSETVRYLARENAREAIRKAKGEAK
jgi:hypothetical protein